MRALLFAMALLLPLGAEAATCSATKGNDGTWSWRLVDGKKCWYRGMPGLSKSSLQWAARDEQIKPTSTSGNAMYLDCVQSGGDRCDSLRTSGVPQDESALERWVRRLRTPWRQ